MRKILELNGVDAIKTAAYYMYREDLDNGVTNNDYLEVVDEYLQHARDHLGNYHEFPTFENTDYPIVVIVNDNRSRYFPVMIYRAEHDDEIIVENIAELPRYEEWAIIDTNVSVPA